MLRKVDCFRFLIITLSFGLITACDQGEVDTFENAHSVIANEDQALVDQPVNWDNVPVPMPAGVAGSLDYGASAPLQQSAQLPHWLTLETFVFSTSDALAVTSAAGGLFGPFPQDIPLLEEDEISNGFLFATKFYDLDDNLVGFGTEQEVQDLDNAAASTTFAMTISGRGTLMLGQEEDFSVFFAEIEDMIVDQEFVRTFEPPLVEQTTVNGTGWIIGGTGEFEGVHGIMREIDVVREINLPDQAVDVTVIIQVLYW